MSNTHPSTTDGVLTLESPIEALQASPRFDGPVEPLEGSTCNDHFALIYESRADQFAAAIPFVRQGLRRGERCMYVVDDNSEATVRAAMTEHGIDVEGAVASGALSFETIEDTYLRGGSFDADEMMDLYADEIEATAGEFEALRLAAETSWILEDDVTMEEFMAYESRVNEVFADEDAIALCQYDRNAFPADALYDVVRVHPHLIYDSTVCHNFYYTPPEEFCDAVQPEHDLDRMLGTLLDRTTARSELRERERSLQRLNEITADPDLSFEEKLQALFDLGCERFDLELGAMARVDVDEDWFEIEYVGDDHEHFEPGVGLALSETYCTAAADVRATESVSDPVADGYDDRTVYEEFGIRAYLGTYVGIDGGCDRTFFFVDSEPHPERFTDGECEFLRSMGQWVQYEFEQHRRERELERTIDSLETSNERLEQFAYAASHDLQEPLRMVSTYLQLLEDRYGDAVDGDGEEFLEFAVDGADRMREMVEGLLAYSRVDTQGDPLEPIELDEVFEDVRTDVQLEIEETGATIDASSLPRVRGDGNQLRQLLQNLLQNALTYAGDAPPRIDVSAERDGSEWVVSVSDEGIGIAPEDRDRIFDVFDRLHSRNEYDGAGIGLALCERIVERHGGEIWVESTPGEGSTFSFTLPAADGGA